MQIDRTYGWLILAFALVYIFVETYFFAVTQSSVSNHLSYLPSCAEEVIADGIGLLIACLGFALLAFTNKSN
jgi:mannose/fructose/N-acetylgalactosamine-specific phosphotransferase system component IIC